MQLKPEQLAKQLAQNLLPVYLVTGDETLLINETIDLIRQFAKKSGFLQRMRFQVERGFDWQEFKTNTDNFSLFSEKTLLELRNESAKFDKTAAALLQAYCESPPADKILIIVTGKLTGAQKNTNWYKAIDKAGAIITLWPLNPNQFIDFIRTRLKDAALIADVNCVKLIAELTQGNLLATDQAIQKLKLSSLDGNVTPELIGQVVNDASRYSVFDWSQYLLLGQTQAALHCLTVLKQTGTEPILLLWLLARELRVLYQYYFTKQFGYEWPARLTQLQAAARRLNQNRCAALLAQCSELDLTVKGLRPGNNAWHGIENLCVEFCR